jgi:tetratricopeptide (TPR) repeat protein
MALLGLSDIALTLQYWKDAEKIIRKILLLAGGQDVAQNHFVLGRALFAQNKVAEANQAFRQSLSLQPDLRAAQIALDLSRQVARSLYTPDYGDSTVAVIATCVFGTMLIIFLIVKPNRKMYEEYPSNQALAKSALTKLSGRRTQKIASEGLKIASIAGGMACLVAGVAIVDKAMDYVGREPIAM